MSTTVGKSVTRVDAYDKVTGRTKYYEDRMPGSNTPRSPMAL